jgi:hypothetical protein
MSLNELIAQGAQFKAPDLLGQYAAVQGLQQGMQQNQMNQMNMLEKSRSLAEQEGLRNYLRTNPSLDTPEGLQGLNQYGGAGQALIGSRIKQRQEMASAQKSAADAGKTEYETARTKLQDALKDAAGLTTPGAAITHINNSVREGKITQEKADQVLSELPQDLAKFGEWRTKMMTNLMSAQNQLEQHFGTIDNGQTITQFSVPKNVPGAAPTILAQQQKQMTPGAAESNRIAQGNLEVNQGRLGVAKDRLEIDRKAAEAKVNPSEKPLTPLQQQAFRKTMAVDADSVKSSNTMASELEKIADELLGNPEKKMSAHPGLGGITGYAALVPNLPEGDAAKAQQKLETFKGKINSLGRTLATQDGKLGNMAVQEWKIVADAVQNIDPKAGNLDEQMRDVVRQAKAFTARHKERFDLTYENADALLGKKSPAAASGSNSITTPDGMTHTFPDAASAAKFRKAAGL